MRAVAAAPYARGTRGARGPCTSPATGTATWTAAEIMDMLARGTYANVHTAKNPDGEIRGQITRAFGP
jgi:CHRD domain